MARQLRMFWPGTERPPEIHLPEGYAIRSFCEGDEEKYAAVCPTSGVLVLRGRKPTVATAGFRLDAESSTLVPEW